MELEKRGYEGVEGETRRQDYQASVRIFKKIRDDVFVKPHHLYRFLFLSLNQTLFLSSSATCGAFVMVAAAVVVEEFGRRKKKKKKKKE